MKTPKTSVKIEFGLFDTTAKSDSNPSVTDSQPFVNVEDLKLEKINVGKYATLEENQFLLDGNFDLFPDSPSSMQWGLWSNCMSNNEGLFAIPPQITFSFSQSHSSLGLTLVFYESTNDYSSEVNIIWCDHLNNIISEKIFYPTSAKMFVENKVDDYRKIVVTFIKTNKPYRYLKLSAIQYGLLKILNNDEIEKANILEEINPLSDEISINTLEFELHSENADFSILNPKGLFSLLQQRQKLRVIETVDTNEINMGTFYLDDWSNDKENNSKMKAVDLIGIIDKTRFNGGIYQNTSASTIIQNIMLSANVEYSLDTAFNTVALSGYIPICTHREALQQVAFAIGAIVDCSREDKIRIYPPTHKPSSLIGYNKKFDSQTLKLKSLVTGVDVITHSYTKSDTVKELLNERLEVGSYRIEFSSPIHSVTATNATIIKYNVNFADIEVVKNSEVVLTGKEYIDNKQVVSRRTQNLSSGASPNVLKVENATLVSLSNAKSTAERIYDYYQNRYENEFSMVVGDEAVSDFVLVESMRNEKLRGIIETMNIDLTGGFIGKTKISGVRIETISGYYTGEIYTGERVGVL